MVKSIAVVGANLAGGRAAEALRMEGFEGQVILIGDEPWRPYERPPLSKELLWDDTPVPDQFFLHEESFYADNAIDLRLSTRVEKLDLAGGCIKIDNGSDIVADRILLCTGSRVRRLSIEGADLTGIHYLRTYGDAMALAEDLQPGARAVIVGLGVIGGEVAASALKRGCKVTAIETEQVPMVRTFGPDFGAWIAQKHQQSGVDLKLGVSVDRFIGNNGKVTGVITSDGETVEADVVVVGVGVIPATELAEGANIDVNNGIVVDQYGQTSNPHVYAAGDVANQPDFFRGRVRLETFQNAQDQAIAAAANMIGKSVEHLKPSWFWSDQYNLNIQVAGRIDAEAEVVLRGDREAEDFSMFFLSNDIIEGVLTVNRAKEMSAGKRMVERRLSVAAAELSDESVNLRSLLKKR